MSWCRPSCPVMKDRLVAHKSPERQRAWGVITGGKKALHQHYLLSPSLPRTKMAHTSKKDWVECRITNHECADRIKIYSHHKHQRKEKTCRSLFHSLNFKIAATHFLLGIIFPPSKTSLWGRGLHLHWVSPGPAGSSTNLAGVGSFNSSEGRSRWMG